jgi:ribonuclease G
MTEKALEEYNVRFYEEGKNLSLGAIIRTSAEFVSEDELKLELNSLVHTMNGIVDYGMHSVVKKLIYSPDRSIKNELIDIKNKQKYDSFNIITDLEEEYNLLSVDFGSDIKLYNDKMVALHKVFNLEDKLKKAFDRFIYLKSGGSIIVEPTEALTVIDVNTGKAIKGKNTEKSFLKINKEAAEAIAKVIRLRNISGIIIIDFINMKEIESIKELLDYLKKQLDKDEVKVTFVDMTPLGLVELTRKKEAKPLTLQDFL